VLAAVVVAGASGAAARQDRAGAGLTVYAAASLTDALPAFDRGERYSFGGSNALAAQIANGAPADVFASANTSIPAQLYAKGLVEKPVAFTRNALVIVVPRSNPARIHTVYDLARPGVKIDVANASVPVGGYTLQILRNLNLTARVSANFVSQETDVREVLAKVALGQADAGFVYSSDARTVPGKVTVLDLPARAQPKVTYAVAVVARSPHQAAAKAYVNALLGKAGQAVLQRYGFLPVTKQARKPIEPIRKKPKK
jgi:molybdate transport system substrate-binding protein